MPKDRDKPRDRTYQPGPGGEQPPPPPPARAPRIYRPDLLIDLEKGLLVQEQRSRAKKK